MMAVGYETAACIAVYTTQQYGMWKELVAVSGRSSVVRAPGFDSQRLPGSFPHSLFQPVYVVLTSY